MLIDRQIKSLRTDLPQIEVYDRSIPGFGVRVTNKGRKSFFLFYRARRAVDAGRKLRRVTFGSYPYVSLADARERAKAILLEVGAGKDPNAGTTRQYVHRRSTHRAGRTPAHPKLRTLLPDGYFPGTFGELAASYMSQHVWLHSKAPRHYESDLKRDLLPQWKDKPLSEIGRREVAALLGRDRRTGRSHTRQQPEEPARRYVQLGHQPGPRDHQPRSRHEAAGGARCPDDGICPRPRSDSSGTSWTADPIRRAMSISSSY